MFPKKLVFENNELRTNIEDGLMPMLFSTNSYPTLGANIPTFNVYSNSSVSNPATFYYYTQRDPNEGGSAGTPNLYVRVSFDVVPNDGSKKTTIVKTFLTNQL